jgi:small subunit ribosomal protein S20
MPNIKSAKKRVLVIDKKTMRNKAIKSALKTQVKKFLAAVEAGDKAKAQEAYNFASKKLDKAVTKGIHHKNYASRQKSRLSKALNQMA